MWRAFAPFSPPRTAMLPGVPSAPSGRGVKTLAAHPEIGRAARGLSAEFREWFIPFGRSGYAVRYRFDGAAVAILAIRHGREAGY